MSFPQFETLSALMGHTGKRKKEIERNSLRIKKKKQTQWELKQKVDFSSD